MNAPALSVSDLAVAAGLILLNAALTQALALGLARQILIAALRMVLQLAIVGLVLKALFAVATPWLALLAAAVMMAAAGREVGARQQIRLTEGWSYGLGAGLMALATTAVLVLAMTTTIALQPWWSPRYLIPLVGIVLGSTMNGVSLALNGFVTTVSRERVAIEAQLALGETRFTALKPFIRSAIRNGLIPIFNQMAAAGLITLPGMMTGQILAGMAPDDAVKYQILILFLLGGATGLGAIGVVYAAAWRLTDERHRLRLERLRSAGGGLT